MLRQFVLFTGIGAIGTIVHYLVLILLVQLAGSNAVLASSAGFISGAAVNYILNYRYTFRSGKRHREAMAKFFTIAGIGFILNGAIMDVLTSGLSLHFLIAQIIATGCVLIWNFLGNRFWTFRKSP